MAQGIFTKSHKRKVSASLKKWYADPENKKKMFDRRNRPEVIEKQRRSIIETLKDPEVRKKYSRPREKNNFWKGGRYIANGYVMVHIGKKKYIQEHRLVMETKLKRKLLTGEVVHHINGNRQDNREENLVVMSKSKNNKCGSPMIKMLQRRIRQLEKKVELE